MQNAKVFRSVATWPGEENTEAYKMHTGASLFVQDAADLGDRNSAGQYVLAIHGIQLALKSFLHRKGVSLDDLEKKFGHKLRKLLNKAYAEGLPRFGVDVEQIVDDLDVAAERAKIRYEVSFGLPISANVIAVATTIVRGTYHAPPSP